MGAGFWIVIGLLAVLLLSSGNKKTGKSSSGRKNDKRIDHLHYMDLDEYQCPNCKARFRKNVMTCPKCGMQFTGTVTDDEEFIEEMEVWEEEDDEYE